jgi:transcriptional regulator with XRE-family HTH domain
MKRKYVQQLSKEEMQEYGEFFRSMRKSIGYSQKKMAEKVGVFYTTIYRWEKGNIVPNQDIYEIEERIRNVVKAAKVS